MARGEKLVWGDRTYVMGVINATPDSFSGDGLGSDISAIVDLAVRMEAEGADFLDVGAESTRPGFRPHICGRRAGAAVARSGGGGLPGPDTHQRGHL